MAKLELKNIKKSFGDAEILKGIDLEIADGEFVVFVGPSGCGKSTALRIIAGLENPTEGKILIDGVDVTNKEPIARQIAMVFQSYALYPHLNVYDNMAFALKLAKMDKAVIDKKVQEAAEVLNIAHLLKRKPKDLSGGQRQRVAIGRAIVRNPKIFLFDEPLSNLDAALRNKMRYEFARIGEQLATTIIYVTHDQIEAMTLADKIVVLNNGEISQAGSPLELYNNPQNRFVAEFIGNPKMNFLSATAIELPNFTITDKVKATIGIRPEHLKIDDSSPLKARVKFIENLGGITYAYLAHPASDEAIIVQLTGDVTIKQGDEVGLDFDTAKAFLFDENGNRI